MPNCYGRLADFKAELKGSGAGTSDDTVLLRVHERASRGVDEFCRRSFFHLQAQTRIYEGGDRAQHMNPRELWLPDDLLAVTSLKVDQGGDGTYETTLAVNTDYWLWPYNPPPNTPYNRIDLNPQGAQLSSWPTSRHRVQLIGTLGYSQETAAAGTIAEDLDTSETGVDLTAGHDVGVGDTVIVDSEQMDVTVVATNTATVTRGVNGSTAATHSNGAAITRRRFPREIELATVMQAARFFREIQTGYSGSVGNAEIAGYAFRSMYPAIRDLLKPYVVDAIA